MSIAWRLRIALLLAAMLPLSAFSIWGVSAIEDHLVQRAFNHLGDVARLQRARVVSVVDSQHERLALVASRTQLRLNLQRYLSSNDLAAQAGMNKIINEAALSVSDLQSISVIAPNGDIVAATQSKMVGRQFPASQGLTQALVGQSTVNHEQVDDGIVVTLYGPLILNNQIIGALVMTTTNDNLESVMQHSAGLGRTGESLLATKITPGRVLYLTPTRFGFYGGAARTVSFDRLGVGMKEALTTVEPAFKAGSDYRGAQVLAVALHIPELNWGIVTKINRDEALDLLTRLTKSAIGIGVCLLVLTLIAAMYLSRSISRPMRFLLDAARSIEQGDLKHRIAPSGGAEYESLANSFNDMIASLQETHDRLEHQVKTQASLERRFRMVIEAAPSAMVMCGQDGTISLVNAATEMLFGYHRDELIGQPVEMLVPDRFNEAHPRHREKYFALPSARAMGAGRDLFGQRKDGTEVPIEIGLNPIDMREGTMVLGAIIDLTERRRIESDLKLRNEKLAKQDWLKSGQSELAHAIRGDMPMEELAQTVIDYLCNYLKLPLGAFYVIDESEDLIFVAGHAVTTPPAPKSLKIGEGPLGQAAKDGQCKLMSTRPEKHLSVRTSGGTTECAHSLIIPLLHGSDTLGVIELANQTEFHTHQIDFAKLAASAVAVAIVVSEKTHRLQTLLDETQQKSRQLETAHSYKSAFLANLSHELKTPLNSVLMLAEKLADNAAGNLSSDQVQSAKIIEHSGRDLLHLINDILDMSKLEASAVSVKLDDLNIRTFVASVCKPLAPLAAQKGLQFDTSINDDVPIVIRSDAQRLAQVLRNLLSNAIKFCEQGSVKFSVHLATHNGLTNEHEQRVYFSVEDTGPGIANDMQGEIFKAFHQIEGNINRMHEGTGLGLSIARKLMLLLGGEIALESKPGVGSKFSAWLPVQSGEPQLPGTDESASITAKQISPEIEEALSSLSNQQILIASNDMRLAFSLSRILEESGYKSNIVSSEPALIEAFNASCFEVLFASSQFLQALETSLRNVDCVAIALDGPSVANGSESQTQVIEQVLRTWIATSGNDQAA